MVGWSELRSEGGGRADGGDVDAVLGDVRPWAAQKNEQSRVALLPDLLPDGSTLADEPTRA